MTSAGQVSLHCSDGNTVSSDLFIPRCSRNNVLVSHQQTLPAASVPQRAFEPSHTLRYVLVQVQKPESLCWGHKDSQGTVTSLSIQCCRIRQADEVR